MKSRFMIGRCLWFAAALFLSANALAQTPAPAPGKVIGKVTRVEGLVTVSDTKGISRVALNDPVIDRTRYVTSSSGSVTLKMDQGCDIELKPNQALTVEDDRTCEALWALIGSFGAGRAAALFLVGGSVILILGGGGGGGTPDTPVTPPGNGGQLPDISPQ